MNDCIFCKIAKGEIPADKVYEDKNCLAFLDITPINPGHVLLIPKEHYENLYDLPDEELKNLAPIIKKLAVAIKKGVNAEGINIGMNNERPAGQLVPHAHFHIMPRFSNDNLRHWPGKPYQEDESKQVAEQIKKFL
ncbi:HIT family protein [Patescibacteria group bacterium]|nr:HIT family protein [Patescibacteria group bacterium]MBU2219382.1 HIT family protein [Patescibacteria group bacterium]